MEASLEKLDNLSVPGTSPSLQVKTAVDLGSSTDEPTKLSVLQSDN
jgi:hypothetical protein